MGSTRLTVRYKNGTQVSFNRAGPGLYERCGGGIWIGWWRVQLGPKAKNLFFMVVVRGTAALDVPRIVRVVIEGPERAWMGKLMVYPSK